MPCCSLIRQDVKSKKLNQQSFNAMKLSSDGGCFAVFSGSNATALLLTDVPLMQAR
jgi:hypothetical protein